MAYSNLPLPPHLEEMIGDFAHHAAMVDVRGVPFRGLDPGLNLATDAVLLAVARVRLVGGGLSSNASLVRNDGAQAGGLLDAVKGQQNPKVLQEEERPGAYEARCEY